MRSAHVVLGLLLIGCSKPGSKSAPPAEDVVATVGERVFTLADVDGQLEAQPDFVRARFNTPERKREFVDSLVRTELLVQEARRQGIDRRPEVQALFEKLVVQQLLTELARKAAPTDADARAYYDAHLPEFSRPERVRVSVLEFGGTSNEAPPDKAAVEKELLKLRSLKPAEQARAFAALVLKRSTHESSRGQEGDVGPRTRDELAQQFSAQVAEAAFGLKEPGSLSAATESQRGLVVVRLIARQPGEQRPFESEKAQLLMRLTAETRTKEMEKLVAALQSQTKPTINEKALEQFRVNPVRSPQLSP
jgi:parvulin-like peptidyl-prolyl isomerase